MPEEMSRPKISAMAVAAEDRISSLPDEVLSHILSFLPTKQAVATSVLSKMWTHLWRSVVVLDFSGTILETSEAHFLFHKFMYSVLRSRDAVHPITSFCLEIEDRVDDSLIPYHSHHHVFEWVNIVVQHSVEYLHLKLCDSFDLPLTIPISILTCRTLVVLKLSGFHAKRFCIFSNPFGFPSLKTLHLERIRFPEDRDYVLLLAGCPILEDLLACDVAFGRKNLRTCQKFKRLRLSYLTRANLARCDYSYFPLRALYNLEFLRIQAFRFFYAKEFRYIGELDRCEMYRWHRPCDDIPIFHHLTHLVLDSDWYLVVEVLQHCPKLQNLTLRQELHDNWEETIWTEEDKWVEPEFVPQCLSLYLRTCTIREFAGLQRELMLARYILKNARVLQTMTIWSRNNREQPEIERNLSPCPRASVTCQFSVF